jgi:peptidoglycan biosynthesis protein MviN/MurJ (putative lipid II flippase)
MYVYSTLLTANGSIRLLNKISIIVVVINLALHFYFIPILKSEGAAVSVLITEWFVAAMVIYFSHKTFSLPHNLVWLLSHIGFVVAETILIFIIKQSTHFLPVQLLLIMISSVLLLFAFRFWTLTSFKELFKR